MDGQRAYTEGLDGGKNVIGIFRPCERGRGVVVVRDEVADSGFQR